MALEKSYGTDGHGALQLSKPHEAPDFLFELPEIQLLNIANNKGIDGLNGAKDGTGNQLTADWEKLANAPVGAKLQILYLSNNNLTKFPPHASLNKMRKLGLLDCINNNLTGKLEAFGKEVELTTLTLNNNRITEILKISAGSPTRWRI